MKKKLLIVSTLIPPVVGGAEKIAASHAALLARRFDVHLLTLSPHPDPIPGVKIHSLPQKPLPTLYYSFQGKSVIDSLLEREHFDYIHSHMALPWGYVLRNAKAKKVITLHGCEYIHKDLLHYVFVKQAFKHADAVISPSSWLAEYVENRYGQNCIVIPNGIDTKIFRRLSTYRSAHTVFYAGRLLREKGILELLECAKRFPEINFRFAGMGPLEPSIDLDNTELLGTLSPEGLVKEYNKATVCIFPSYRENYPTVALEALSCGAPVIASRTGFSEIVEHERTGLILDTVAPDEIERALDRLLTDKKLQRRFAKDIPKKAQRFSAKAMADDYAKVYASLR
ncbi:glycosyltransferase family 4 protein [Candidatus Woesearchaeota archaeon]|nr:glycosyltransferase family 4 protein [Candidatus Woesearchaeota archaeon]